MIATSPLAQSYFLRQAQEIDIIHSHSIDVGIEALGAKVAGLNEELYV